MDIITYALLKNSKADLVNGKVPASELPSYVDEVIEVANKEALPAIGDSSKIYVTLDTKNTYRWSGSTYVQVGGIDVPQSTVENQVLVSTNQAGRVNWNNIKTINGQSIFGEGDLPAGLVDDVKVDGRTVIVDKVANIDLATPLATKQDKINDLATIRQGAQKGNTALQPNDNVSKLVNDAGYLTEHQSLTDYAKKTEVATEKTERQTADIQLQTNINTKQDKLTAGTGIKIENNILSALDATIGKTFKTTVTVGHLQAGTDISATETLKDILYSILCGGSPTTTFFSQYLESSTIPSTIDNTWTQNEITEVVKETGLPFKVVGDLGVGFISFAFNKSLGLLKHIYENDTPIDILSSWDYKVVTYNNIEYYMYYIKDPTDVQVLVPNDTYVLYWK